MFQDKSTGVMRSILMSSRHSDYCMLIPLSSHWIGDVRPGEDREMIVRSQYEGFVVGILYLAEEFSVTRAHLGAGGSGMDLTLLTPPVTSGPESKRRCGTIEPTLVRPGQDICLCVSRIGPDLAGGQFSAEILLVCPDLNDPSQCGACARRREFH